VDAADWDTRYAGSALVWGAGPNQFVAAELESLPPGRALDVACGEGRNAIWLASRKWRAVGVDYSATGLDRAARLATEVGVADRARFALCDVVTGPLPAGPFDAVVVAYLQLPAAHRRSALHRAVRALAPGGTLLIVGHDTSNLIDGFGGPRDPGVLFTPQDVLADLSTLSDLVVEKARRVRRTVPAPWGDRVAIDALVRIRRAATGE
jgi:SAM-dependent methyltransferase